MAAVSFDFVLAVRGRDRQAIDRRQLLDFGAARWRRALSDDSGRRSATFSSRAKRHRVAGLRFAFLDLLVAHQREDAADRASSPSGPCSTWPSFRLPDSTRPRLSLPPCAAMEGLEDLHHRVVARFYAAARRRFRHIRALHGAAPSAAGARHCRLRPNRSAPAPPGLPPIRARRSSEHFVARRFDIAQQFLHQMLVIIGQPFQHLEARFLLAAQIGDIDHLADAACGR